MNSSISTDSPSSCQGKLPSTFWSAPSKSLHRNLLPKISALGPIVNVVAVFTVIVNLMVHRCRNHRRHWPKNKSKKKHHQHRHHHPSCAVCRILSNHSPSSQRKNIMRGLVCVHLNQTTTKRRRTKIYFILPFRTYENRKTKN